MRVLERQKKGYSPKRPVQEKTNEGGKTKGVERFSGGKKDVLPKETGL